MSDSWRDAPIGQGSIDTEHWWQAIATGVLLVNRCVNGHAWVFPKARCDRCGSTEFGLVESDGRGTVESVSLVRRPPLPDLDPPYAIAVIRTSEGASLLGRVDSSIGADDVHAGDRVSIEFGAAGELPRFTTVRAETAHFDTAHFDTAHLNTEGQP